MGCTIQYTSHPPRKEKRPIIRGRREGGGGGTSKSHVVDANNGRGFLERGRSAFIHGESADRSPEFKDFNVSPVAKQWTMSRRSFSSHVLGCQERERVRRIVYFRTFEATSSVRSLCGHSEWILLLPSPAFISSWVIRHGSLRGEAITGGQNPAAGPR